MVGGLLELFVSFFHWKKEGNYYDEHRFPFSKAPRENLFGSFNREMAMGGSEGRNLRSSRKFFE
jgi:hypothetical protein